MVAPGSSRRIEHDCPISWAIVDRSSVSVSASAGPLIETITQSGEALSYSVTPITGAPATLKTA